MHMRVTSRAIILQPKDGGGRRGKEVGEEAALGLFWGPIQEPSQHFKPLL